MIIESDNESIRTEDLPQTCDWPEMPNASSLPVKGDDDDSQSSILTQDLPNTADWEQALAPIVATENNKFKNNQHQQQQ